MGAMNLKFNNQGVVYIGKELRMRVIIVETNEEPYIENIWNNLKNMRKKIGNTALEVLECEDILIIFDSKALEENLPINRYFNDLAIRGTFIISGNNLEELDFIGLTDEQVDKYMEMFKLDREEDMEL